MPRGLRWRVGISALCLAIGTLCIPLVFGAQAAPTRIQWHERVPQALAEAVERGRPVLVNVWAGWVLPCREMLKTTYKDHRVLEQMAEFVPFQVDIDTDKNFRWEYRLEEYPCVLFLDDKGNEISRLEGMVTAPMLVERMQQVQKGYATYLAKRNSNATQDLRALGRYFHAVGNHTRAIDRFEEALRQLPAPKGYPYERLRLHIAESRSAANDMESAAEELRSILSFAESPGIRMMSLTALIRVETELGNTAAARRLREQMAREDPNHRQ